MLVSVKYDMFQVIGKTHPEGHLVVAGVYKFYETHGLSLDVILDTLSRRGAVPSWIHFYHEASQAGMKHNRISAMLDPAILDVFGADYRDVVLKRLETLR